MPVEHIADPDDPRLADYRELRDPAARRLIEGDELFVAEGPVAIERLLASAHRVRSVVLTEQKFARFDSFLAEHDDLAVYVVDRALLHTLTGFDLHRGAIAAADRRTMPTLTTLCAQARRIVVLEGLNDPENLGAIARSARAFGVDALVLDPTCIDPYTRRTVRVSMGEVLHLQWHRATVDDWPAATMATLAAAGVDTWAMTPAADAADIWSLTTSGRLAFVFGAEGPGLSMPTMAAASKRVCVPIGADVDSLNVAAAAAVTFAITNRPTVTSP